MGRGHPDPPLPPLIGPPHSPIQKLEGGGGGGGAGGGRSEWAPV